MAVSTGFTDRTIGRLAIAEAAMFERRVQQSFEAVRRKDLGAVMKGWSPDGVLEFPGEVSLSGRYVGREAIEGFFRTWFARMETIRVKVRRVGFSGLGLTYAGTMVVEFETDQVTTDGIAFHTEVVGVYRFRRGKLSYYREYLYDQSRLAEVWGPEAGG